MLEAGAYVVPCPIAPVAGIVFGRWATDVLWALIHHERLRFNELRRDIPRVTPKVLAQRLRQLERDGLVTRTYHREMPPRVEYEATTLAHTLVPLLMALAQWSNEHENDVNAARDAYTGPSAA